VGKQEPALHRLIEGCIQRDRKCEELLYKFFYGYLAGVVYRYIRERETIRELVNEAFLRIFKKIDRFTFDGPPEELERGFKGWIGKITANVVIDHLRSRKTLLYIEDMSNEKLKDIGIEMPDRLAYNDIIALLDCLPPIQQLIFNLYENEGFSHREIARRLNMPASTSRVYLTRSKIKLMACYQHLMKISYGR